MKKFLDWYIRFYPLQGVSFGRRVAIHAAFWLFWGLLSILGSISDLTLTNKLIIFSFEILQNATIFYGITYFVIPKLISPKQQVLGILIFMGIYFFFSFQSYGFYILGIKYKLLQEKSFLYHYAQNYVKNGFWGVFTQQNIFFEIYMLLSNSILPFLLKFSRVVSQYYIKAENVSKEKAELEVDFLRTQINPHFFLNALNNIYSQIITKEETAADSVVVLSDLMKYILYNSGTVEVALPKEIKFLRSYIDLEKLKGSRNVKIRFSEEGSFKGYNIAPLILINYVENAFKHGSNNFDKVFLIEIEIKFENGTLFFKIENDFLEDQQVTKNSSDGGIGIVNTKKRLELLYPNRHSLTFKKENNKFTVNVMIQLNPVEKSINVSKI